MLGWGWRGKTTNAKRKLLRVPRITYSSLRPSLFKAPSPSGKVSEGDERSSGDRLLLHQLKVSQSFLLNTGHPSRAIISHQLRCVLFISLFLSNSFEPRTTVQRACLQPPFSTLSQQAVHRMLKVHWGHLPTCPSSAVWQLHHC